MNEVKFLQSRSEEESVDNNPIQQQAFKSAQGFSFRNEVGQGELGQTHPNHFSWDKPARTDPEEENYEDHKREL